MNKNVIRVHDIATLQYLYGIWQCVVSRPDDSYIRNNVMCCELLLLFFFASHSISFIYAVHCLMIILFLD